MRLKALLSIALLAGPTSLARAASQQAAITSITQEQEQAVRAAVTREKRVGLPPPLEAEPDVSAYDKVMVSDAVSIVEVAHADFVANAFYLSVQNPWTNVTDWYGPFAI